MRAGRRCVNAKRALWPWGGLAGLLIALAIPAAALFLAEGAAEFPLAVAFLAAIPPFSPPPTSFASLPWPRLLELPAAYRAGIFLAWWPLLGIYLGWAARQGEIARLIAGMVTIMVAVGHLETRPVIGPALAQAVDGLAALLGL